MKLLQISPLKFLCFTRKFHALYIKFTQHFLRIFQKFCQIFRKNSLKCWQVCPKILRFSINKYYCQNFSFFYGCFTYWSKNWLTISRKFFKIFLKKILKFCYTYYILTTTFLYILFKKSVIRTKNLPLFSTNWKYSHRYFLEFRWISLISLKFPEIFPTIYSKLLKFSRIFFQNFHSKNLIKYCVKML